jgi:hypothetical protein
MFKTHENKKRNAKQFKDLVCNCPIPELYSPGILRGQVYITLGLINTPC